jgi:hypothetical protein
MNKSEKPKNKTQQKQLMLVGILGSLALIIIFYQFFLSAAPPPTTEAKTDQNSGPRHKWDDSQSGNPQPVAQVDNKGAKDANLTPALLVLDDKSSHGDGDVNRNLFVYPPPPPPIPLPPPPPPTVTINNITPLSVYAQTKPFDLIVKGEKFSPEMHIYLNGNPSFAPTKFVSENELSATVPQQFFTNAQPLKVEVKQPGAEDKFFSNSITLTVSAPPQPRFTLVGVTAEAGGINPQAILLENENRQTAGIGDKVSNIYKVVNIGSNFIEVEDVTTAIGVRHQVKMKEETGGPSNATATAAAVTQVETAVQSPVVATPQLPKELQDPDKAAEFAKKREEALKRQQQLNQRFGQPGGFTPPKANIPGLAPAPRR